MMQSVTVTRARRVSGGLPLELLEGRYLLSGGPGGWNVALIDRALPDKAVLVRAMQPGGHVILYDGAHESADQVLARLIDWAEKSHVRIASVSVMSHASAGRFRLGDEWVTKSTVEQDSEEWRRLGALMGTGSRIYLFGCDLADPLGDGQILIDRISRETGAAVFASTNLTGRGGDWTLEAASGGAQSALPALKIPFNLRVLVGYAGTLGTLSGSGVYTSTAVNLTATGTSDWIHWGNGPSPGMDHKATGGNQISNYTLLSGSTVNSYALLQRPMSWTDGSPNATHTETTGSGTIVYTSGSGHGFSFTAPADTQQRTLIVYVSSLAGAGGGKLTATLSDGSAPAYVDSATFPTTQDRTYTITYSASSVGQTLTLVWQSNGTFVGISGAALVGPPTIATPASATPNPVTGTTTNLSVLGAGGGGESTLSYTWATIGTPPAPVTFTANGTNASKNTTATFTKAGTYNFQVTVRDTNGLTTTSSVAVTVNQTLTSILVAPGSASLNWNGTQQFAATGFDQFGNALLAQPAFTWAVSSGIGAISSSGLYTAPAASGSATIRASSGGISGTASVTVTNAAPTIASPASASPNPVSGTTTSLSVLGADDGGESNLIYTWVTTGTPPAPVTFSTNGSNAAKNSTATFAKAGTYSFQVTILDAGGLTTTGSVMVTVNQTLTTIVVTPSSAALNENQTQQFTATAYGQFGNVLVTQPTFTWSVPGGIGTIDGSGLYTAPGATGTTTVRATSGAVSGNASVTITNAAPTVATPAAASPSPVTGTTTNLSALGADDGGESNLTYTWSLSGSPPAPVSFSDNGTNTAKNTTATFTMAGTYAFVVTIADAGGLSTISSVSVTVNQTLTSTSISPASVAVNVNATQQFTATARDQFGHALLSQPAFNWSIVSGGGSVDVSGLYTAPGSTGPATVRASSGGLNADAAVNIANGVPTVVTPANASPNPVTGTMTNLGVLGADDGGESNLTYTWSLTGSPPAGVSYGVNGSNAAKNTTATFLAAGNYHFLVTITDAGGLSTTSSVNVTVNQTLAAIVVNPASASVSKGTTRQFDATAYDQFASPMLTQPAFNWSVVGGGSVNSSGLYTAPGATGSATVRAASGGVSGTASVTVTSAPPTVATPASASPNPVTGTTTNLSVLGADDGGESNLTYTWSLTGSPPAAVSFNVNGTNAAKNAGATFSKAGTYSFLVTITDADGLTTTSSVSVAVNQTLTAMTVTPGAASLNENSTVRFSATAYDQFGDVMAVQPALTWTKTSGIGSIDTTGLYASPASVGLASIRAAAGAVSGSASVAVTNAAPTIATPASAAPDRVTGTTTNLTVLGADDGGETNLTYTWSLTGSPPAAVSFSANGGNVSKNTTATFSQAGTYTFLVTVSDVGGASTLSAVAVTVDQMVTHIVVSPVSLSLSENQSQSFAAEAFDQFGAPISNPPAFTWTSGAGTIDPSGRYTAPRFATTDGVNAAIGIVAGTASVTVTNTPPIVVSSASASPNPVTAATTVLQVLGDDDGGEAALTYQWSALSKPAGAPDPTFSRNSDNAAKTTTATFFAAGDYTFRVSISDGTYITVSDVTVTVTPVAAPPTVPPSPPPAEPPPVLPPSAPANLDVTPPQAGSESAPPPTNVGHGTPVSQHSGGAPVGAAPQPDDQAPAPPQTPPAAPPTDSSPHPSVANPPPGPGPAGPKLPADLPARSSAAVTAAARLARVEPGKLYLELDEVAKQVQASRGVWGTSIQPGTIITTTVTMSAGFLMWLSRGGSLLMSVLGTLPVWRLLDPLPILESWEKKSKATKRKQGQDRTPEEPDHQEQQVRSLVESQLPKALPEAGR